MATTRKVLGQVAPAAATNTDLYTVPAATSVVCSTLVVANRSASTATWRVAVRVNGAAATDKQWLYYNVVLPGADTFMATIGLTLSAGDVVTVWASNANLSVQLFGEETS